MSLTEIQNLLNVKTLLIFLDFIQDKLNLLEIFLQKKLLSSHTEYKQAVQIPKNSGQTPDYIGKALLAILLSIPDDIWIVYSKISEEQKDYD
jgi:hypothetical protein